MAYSDHGNSAYGTAVIGTVSGSTITFGSEYVFNSAGTSYTCAAALTASQPIVVYSAASGGVMQSVDYIVCFPLGVADAAASAGQSVPVILGGISAHHSGLVPEKFYYENLGGLTQDVSLVPVGWAISPTELLLDMQRR